VRSCWAIAARDGPPPKARTSLHRLRMWPELPRHPWHTQRHEPAGAVMRPARRSTVRGACMPPERGRRRRPQALGRHESATDRRSRAERAAGKF
jgi:hypothetical protein